MYFFITNKFIDFSGCKDIHSSNGAIYPDEGILRRLLCLTRQIGE